MGNFCSCRCVEYGIKSDEHRATLEKIIGHDEIIDGFTDKHKLRAYIDGLGPNNVCYLMYCGDELAGVAVALDIGEGIGEPRTWVGDIGFLKAYRGKIAVYLTRMALGNLFKKYKCERLLGIIDKKNRAALVNSRWLGFEVVSTNSSKHIVRYKGNGS